MTHAFKFLIDTNIVIGLEDHHEVDAVLTDLARKCSEFGCRLFVDAAVDDDVLRDRDLARRPVTISKLRRFERLKGLRYPGDAALSRTYGALNSDNDRSDIRLLFCLEQDAADFLITRDVPLLKRAQRCGLSDRVMSPEDALVWLRQTYEPTTVELAHIVEQEVYSLDRSDPIFDGLRADYPAFDQWLRRCALEHRKCWTVIVGGEMAGIVIRKDERRSDACTVLPGAKILKLCTFKMAPRYRGEKFGEHLLKQSLWFAQINRYDLVYLTAFADKEDLITLLQAYGFMLTKRMPNGELMLEKAMHYGPLHPSAQMDIIEFDRKVYPRFYDGERVAKYCVPIKGSYHQKLFPEIGYLKPLPLFPSYRFGRELAGSPKGDRTPGNTIRKVYLCRAQARSLKPGDLLFFYLSKDEGLAVSQSITTVGVVENAGECHDVDDLSRITAKRSVFSKEELRALQMQSSVPVKVIDFLLVAHSTPTVPLTSLVEEHVFNRRPPQSIVELNGERYARLKAMLNLGFDV